MASSDKIQQAFDLFDEANEAARNTEMFQRSNLSERTALYTTYDKTENKHLKYGA